MARSAAVVGSEVQYILVDDGSPGAPLLELYLRETGGRDLGANVLLLRIAENIAWNQVKRRPPPPVRHRHRRHPDRHPNRTYSSAPDP